MVGWAIMLSFLPILAYLITKRISTTKSALISACIFAVHPRLVFTSRELLQPNLLPLFSLLFFLFLSTQSPTTKKNKTIFLSLATFFLFFPLHIHYGVLLIIPIGVISIIYYWFHQNHDKNVDYYYYQALVLLIIALTTILSWVLLTYRQIPFDQIYFLVFNFEKESVDFFTKFATFKDVISNVLYFSTQNIVSALSITTITGLIYFIYKQKNKHKKRLQIFLLLLTLSSSLILFSNGFITETYLLAFIPFFLLSLSVFTGYLLEKNITIGFIVATVIISYFYTQSIKINSLENKTVNNKDQQIIAEIIFKDYSRYSNNFNATNKPKIAVASISTSGMLPYDRWGTSGVWFYLEELFDLQLVSLVSYGVNFQPIEYKPFVFYLVCDNREHKQELDKLCYGKFTSKREYLLDTGELLYSSEDFSVWQFMIDTKIYNASTYIPLNLVDYDLLN